MNIKSLPVIIGPLLKTPGEDSREVSTAATICNNCTLLYLEFPHVHECFPALDVKM